MEHWRKHNEASGGGAFRGLKVAFYGSFQGALPDQQTLVNIVEAGGGCARQLPGRAWASASV